MKQMLQQILQGQASGASDLHIKLADIHNKVDSSHHALTKKIEELNSKVRYLESQQSSTSSSAKGILPGKPIPNPKEFANAITLKSGRVLPDRVAPARSNGGIASQEEEESVDIGANDSIGKEPELEKQRDSRVEPPKGNEKRRETAFVPPPFKPMLPFPTRFKK